MSTDDNETWLRGREALLAEFRTLASGPCPTGKQKHPTKAKARKHLKRLRTERDNQRTSAFRCGYCGDWHVGRR